MSYKGAKTKLMEAFKRHKKFKTGGMVPQPELLWFQAVEGYEILRRKAVRLKDSENETGGKYLKTIILKHGAKKYDGVTYGQVDVYAVLEAFRVTCPAVAHAVKKLLCPGIRGTKNKRQDIKESKDAIIRAFEMEAARIVLAEALRSEVVKVERFKS